MLMIQWVNDCEWWGFIDHVLYSRWAYDKACCHVQ